MKSENSRAMLTAIEQEPELLQAIVDNHDHYTREFVELFKKHNFKRVYLIGSGSPSHVAMVIKYAIIQLLKIDAICSYPMLFYHHEGLNPGGIPKPEETLLICPGETGRTKGPVLAAREAQRLGIPVVCTTLYPQGSLGRVSDLCIVKNSGREQALPSTKGHSTGILILLLCIIEAAYATGKIDAVAYRHWMTSARALASSVRSARICALNWFAAHQDIVMQADTYRMIAYGANYATVLEGALKFIESHRRPTLCYELEEFMHGPIRSVRPEDVIFFLCTEDGPEKERMLQLFRVVQKLTCHCVLIHSASDAFHDDLSLRFEAVNTPLLSAVEYLTPLQVLAYEIADHLGYDTTIGKNQFAKQAMETGFPD